MTTTPAPSTTAIPVDAVQIGDTVASLTGLVTAYSHVLEQAKAQLEQLELTPEQLRNMQLWLKDNVNYARIADALTDKVRYLSDGDDSYEAHRIRQLIESIAQRVSARLAEDSLNALRSEIASLVSQERLDATRLFKEHSEQWFQREARYRQDQLEMQNRDLKRTLRQVLSLAYDDDELNAMAARAIAKPTITSADFANA